MAQKPPSDNIPHNLLAKDQPEHNLRKTKKMRIDLQK
jgi:hypothetical protein